MDGGAPAISQAKRMAQDLRRRGCKAAALAVVLRHAATALVDWRAQLDAGDLLMEAGRWDEADLYMSRAAMLAPERPEVWQDIGQLALYRGNLEIAARAMAKAVTLGGDPEAARYHAGVVALAAGRWREGFEGYRHRFTQVTGGLSYRPHLPLWAGEPLAGRRLAILPDQGAGDLIMVERYFPWLRSLGPARLDLHVPARLRQLFKGHPDLDGVRLLDDKVRADLFVWAGSLPALHGTEPDSVPPQTGHFRRLAGEREFRLEPSPGLKVGIVWAGAAGHKLNAWRSSTLEHFLVLAELPELTLYSFLVGDRSADIQRAGAEDLVLDLSREIGSWADTAAALARMDLVIGVDTGTMHLAGSLGVPCWLLNAASPDWRWMSGEGPTPWYPSMRMFRQRRLGDWSGLLAEVRDVLSVFIAERARRAA